ncbi:MAG: glycosyltransferase [Candidatus Eiseniibacteriota bacterium]|nr:MAG: glycosyltransferase [Candidatus Eisenbacteria bacterium]
MAEKLRFCILGPAYPLRGGIAQYLAILYELLEKTHEVSFISFRRQYPSFLFPGETQLDPGKPRIDVKPKALIDSIGPLSWLKTFAYLKTLRPHLLILKWWTPFFAPCYSVICFLARKFIGSKVLFICDNVIPHERRLVDRFLTALAFSQVDYFITLSHSVTEDLAVLKPRAVVAEIAHPSYSYFTFGKMEPEDARRKLGITRPFVLFFGYVRPYKGVHVLLDAFSKARKSVEATLAVVGEFYEPRDPYVDHITRLGLQEDVMLVDRYVSDEEVGVFFSAADVVILPYISATQSGVIQIAFAFHKPVISTAVGGIPEVVKDGVNGILVPPCDSDALADALRRFFEGGLSGPMVEKIREESPEFSWTPLVQALERFCSESAEV